jgi:hypothetical protein
MIEPDLQDTDRLRLRPERRLRAWEQAARPIGELVDAPLARLGAELSRSVLVHPKQPLDAAAQILERLVAADPVTPEDRSPVADAINALACVGIDVSDTQLRLVHWLPGLTAVEPPFPGRIRGGFAALALSDGLMGTYVAPLPHDVTGGCEFPGDVHKLVGYATWAVRNKGSLGTLENALHRVADELDALCALNQLDEATVLWLARVAFHCLDPGAALAEVAARAHDWLWAAPARLELARSQPAEFPIGATLGDGAHRIEHRLCGTGSNRLYRGVEVATGAPLLIAYDYFRSGKHNVAELRSTIGYDAPGLLSLVHVGHLDGRRDLWAVVERAPSGSLWLPTLVGPADPWTAPRKSVELGASAGRILLGALHIGPSLLSVRPEMMWGTRRDGHYVVTGLSPRGHALFARSREDAASHPLFLYHYRDPLWQEPGFAFDDRSLTFSLAVMIAEWTMGVYPLRQTWGYETADHIPIEAPPALGALLELGLSPTLDARPPLDAFVAELEQLAARM